MGEEARGEKKKKGKRNRRPEEVTLRLRLHFQSNSRCCGRGVLHELTCKELEPMASVSSSPGGSFGGYVCGVASATKAWRTRSSPSSSLAAILPPLK